MSMVVQHNMQAANANRMLGITSGAQAKSTEKLSSGYKINRAADDAAGLTISEKMRKQIRGLDKASSNAQDGVSSVQTAEGALTEVHSMLQRMNELAVQSANGTNSSDDRQAIQDEVDQLTTEIDRVAETTKFNEIYLLKGDNSNTKNVYMKGHDAGLKGSLTDGAKSATFTMDALKTGDKVTIAGKEYSIGSTVADAKKTYAAAADGEKVTIDGTEYTVVGATGTEDAGANKLKVASLDAKVKDGSTVSYKTTTVKAMTDADNNGIDDDDSSIISKDGAESKIKDELLTPFIDLKTDYYDLGLEYRNETDDQVTIDSANATKKYGVAVKCATITPNAARMDEYDLKEMWKSPNGTIRAILDGTVFRAPIVVKGIEPCVKNWKKPITIARHAYGDVYKSVSFETDEPGECTMTFKGASGKEQTVLVQKTDGPAVFQGEHNKESSIRSFARACFQYAIDTKQDLWFSTKDTIAKVYDGAFKRIFEEEYEKSYRTQFEALGLRYFYTLIDDAVARVIRSEGGFIWACKNYDGDVMSDMVSTAFGSLAMMTSVLVAPDGTTEFEAAHGTVTKHYYRYLKGEQTSTNPMATIFAWTGALKKRGQLDKLPALEAFADRLEQASLDTIRSGIMTGDLADLVEGERPAPVTSEAFLKAIRARMEA